MAKQKHFYVRVMQKEVPETYSPEELEALQRCAQQAPGVVAIRLIERHPRGGYAVHLEYEGELSHQLAEYFDQSGYMWVI